jgi:hypothetical protein
VLKKLLALFHRAPQPHAEEKERATQKKGAKVTDNPADEKDDPQDTHTPSGSPVRRRIRHVLLSVLILLAGTAAWHQWRSTIRQTDDELTVAPHVRASSAHASAPSSEAMVWLPTSAASTSQEATQEVLKEAAQEIPPAPTPVSSQTRLKIARTAARTAKHPIAVVLFCAQPLPALYRTLKQLSPTLSLVLPAHAAKQANQLPTSYPVFVSLELNAPHFSSHLEQHLHAFPHAVGGTYKVGSAMLANATFMKALLSQLKTRKLFFLDTGASLASVARKESSAYNNRIVNATWVVRHAEQLRHAHTHLRNKPLVLVLKGSWHKGAYFKTLKRFLTFVQRSHTYQLTFATHMAPHR